MGFALATTAALVKINKLISDNIKYNTKQKNKIGCGCGSALELLKEMEQNIQNFNMNGIGNMSSRLTTTSLDLKMTPLR